MNKNETNEWIIQFSQVGESGLRKKLDLTDKQILNALSEDISVDEIISLSIDAKITRYKDDGLSATGNVKARVRQACVVSLEPIESDLKEAFEVHYLPDAEVEEIDLSKPLDDAAIAKLLEEDDPPEPLVNNQISLVDIAREFLSLGVNPYPRKEDATFIDPEADKVITPFDILKNRK